MHNEYTFSNQFSDLEGVIFVHLCNWIPVCGCSMCLTTHLEMCLAVLLTSVGLRVTVMWCMDPCVTEPHLFCLRVHPCTPIQVKYQEKCTYEQWFAVCIMHMHSVSFLVLISVLVLLWFIGMIKKKCIHIAKAFADNK